MTSTSAASAFADTLETLDVAIETLLHQTDASASGRDDQTILRRDVDQGRSAAAARAVAGLKLSAVKLAVLAGGAATGLDPVVLSSMLKEVTGSALGLSAACVACVDSSASAATQPLRKAVINNATLALKAVRTLVNVVKGEVIREQGPLTNDQAVTRAAAEVVGACDTLSRSAWSNKMAIGRCFARSARSIDDARRELAAGIKDSPMTENLDLDLDDLEVAELTPAESKVASAVLVTLEGITSFLRQALRTLQASSSDDTDWQAWENAEFHVQSLAQMLDELAAAVYPPQDPESLAECADAVGNGLELLQEEALPDWGWEEALNGILNTIGRVREVTAQVVD